MSVESSALNVERSAPRGAVFLSYASQDADAARRIAEALRAAGVEVWFDQNELVGGDAWDAKIRGQIASCALFVPVISAATQARLEGYFRIEWKLAAQRTHAMAEEKAFLLPVVIDDTRDAEAKVPAEFKAVQWTRLPGGAIPEKFCARVAALIAGSAAPELAAGPRATPSMDHTPAVSRPAWRLPVAVVVGGLLAVAWWRPWDPRGTSSSLVSAPPVNRPGVPKTASESAVTVSSLLSRVRALVAKTDIVRPDLDTAANLLAEAAKLEPTTARIWAELALVDLRYWEKYLDRSAARQASALRHAAQAASLDSEDPLARFAQAAAMTLAQRNEPTVARARQILEPVVDRITDRADALYFLASLEAGGGNLEKSLRYLDRAAAIPGEAGRADVNRCWAYFQSGRMWEADAAIDRALAVEPSAYAKQIKAFILAIWHGDTAAAPRLFADIPPEILLEDYAASARFFIELWCGNPEQALAAIRVVPRDFIESQALYGPTGYFRGIAHARAGRRAAAEVEWRAALALVQRELVTRPNEERLLTFLALLQWELGDQAAALKVWQTIRELTGGHFAGWTNYFLQMTVLPEDEAIAKLEQPSSFFAWRLAGNLRLDPFLDRLRKHPRFKALLVKAEADPRLSPRAGLPDRRDPPAAVPAGAHDKSVAVLPFKNLSGDPAREFFSDGLSEAVTDVLGRVPGLKVVGSTSAFSFKGKAVPIPEIARQLGVSHVVEGTVLQDGATVRIAAKLLKADGFQVWVSDKIERPVKNIFALHDEIAGHIARNLELKLGVAASAAGEVNPEAYQSYLTGRAAMAKAGMEELRQAVPHFEQAVALAPRFTAAWVQLAAVQTQLGRWGGSPARQAWAAAHAAIERAMALEPDSPDVLLALGWIRRTAEWDWRGAERAFRRALELRPNHPDTLSGAAVLLFNIGKTDEAFQLSRQAVQLDPLNPAAQIDLALMFYFNESWVEAERAARRALELGPGGAGYHAVLGWSLAAQQRHAEAEAELARESSEVERINGLGWLAVARGQVAEARRYLARLEEIARTDHIKADLHQSIAWLCASLGDKDRAFAALENARASRDPSVAWSRTMWPLRPLYTDPRWADFLRSVGLTDAQLK